MLVRIHSKIPHGSKSFSKAKRKFGIFTCEQCSKEFERWKNLKIMLNKEVHFCTLKCAHASRKKGGIIDRQRVATNLERHGAEYVIARPDVAREMARRANLPPANKKRKATMLERHGVESGLQLPHAIAACKKANRKPETIARRRRAYEKTMLERYGVRSAFQLASCRIKCNTPAACEKRWKSICRSGRATTSAPEEMMADLLIARYGTDAIERHSINLSKDKRESIDFHVRSLDLYIQVDGVYWHGLDRPLEEVMVRQGRQGEIIRRKWHRDRALDEYCKQEDIRLARVTDREMKDPAWSFEWWIEGLECMQAPVTTQRPVSASA